MTLGSAAVQCGVLEIGRPFAGAEAARRTRRMETGQGGLVLQNDSAFQCFSLLFKGTNTGVTS
jgi:hypothetical protein